MHVVIRYLSVNFSRHILLRLTNFAVIAYTIFAKATTPLNMQPLERLPTLQ